jgi:hypothetical protein
MVSFVAAIIVYIKVAKYGKQCARAAPIWQGSGSYWALWYPWPRQKTKSSTRTKKNLPGEFFWHYATKKS